jgi:glycosyltransferase involved in cell wall biosynthesis
MANNAVELLTLSRFEANNSQGIPRYVNELYKEVKTRMPIEKRIIKYNKILRDLASFELGTFLQQNKGCQIIHNPVGFFIARGLHDPHSYITTMHDLNPFFKNISEKVFHIMFERSIEYNIKRSKFIIANSTQTKQELLERGYPSKQMTVINLGLDNRFLLDREKSIVGKFMVGYVGSFAENKNVGALIDAFSNFNDSNAVLELWGKPAHKFKELRKKSCRDKRISFKGIAPESRIVEIYDTFDVLVYPSLYEGFGLSILEAQARGLPVIIYKKSRIPKEVRKFCIEVEDQVHLTSVLLDIKENGYNNVIQKKAMAYARAFTWNRTAVETIKVYEKLLE